MPNRTPETLPDQLLPDPGALLAHLPDMDGPTATAEIRRWPGTQGIALISFPEPGLLQRVLQAGAISYT